MMALPLPLKLVSRLPLAFSRIRLKSESLPLKLGPATTILPSGCKVTQRPLSMPLLTGMMALPVRLKLASKLPSAFRRIRLKSSELPPL